MLSVQSVAHAAEIKGEDIEAIGPNLLANPSFEEGTADSGIPTGWSLYGGLGPKRSIAVKDAPGREGSVACIADNHTSQEVGLTQRVPGKGGVPYIASADVALVKDRSPAGAYLQMRFLPSNEFAQRPLCPGLGGAFAETMIGMVAPSGTTHIQLYLYTHAGPVPHVLLDNARLVAVKELPKELNVPAGASPPEIEVLKNLHLETELVKDGRARAVIIAPASGIYEAEAKAIAAAVAKATGVRMAVRPDSGPEADIPLPQNAIILGNRSTNALLGTLYERYYTLLDLRYPGPGGFVVRSLHNPFGNGRNAILVGGSDAAGVGKAADRLIARITEAQGPNLSLGWTMDIELGDGVRVPTDLREFETWEASAGYRSVGYFGWNSISKRMAMYYMTGEEAHAREALRLAFPDEQAKKEIAEIDGERIENKDDPLGGPYHYNAHMMILYWDLIEESPAFTDEERLRVTRAFTHQLNHHGIRRAYVGPYAPAPAHVGSRHGQWTALSLYCLGRYFAKDYDDPIWPVCEENGALHFAPLHSHAWVSGENDNLFWYSTAIAPIFTYMCLSGDRIPVENGVVDQLLRGQEMLVSGRQPDWALKYASIGYLHKAAHITGDGRWLAYRDRTGANLDIFRLGQSYWPGPALQSEPPKDLVNTWQINPLPTPMWKWRNSGLPEDESYLFMSYRNATDASGDFILLDGFNGASRNPYHTFAVLQLRLDGLTLLEGYLNQVLTRVDGLVEEDIAMDAALKHQAVVGNTVTATGFVPNLAYASWERTLVQRAGRYALVIDSLTPRTDTDNLEVQILWESGQGKWRANSEHKNRLELTGAAAKSASQDEAPIPVIVSSEEVDLTCSGKQATMTWTGPATDGAPKHFFSLVAVDSADDGPAMDCLTYPGADTFAALALPDPAMVGVDVDTEDFQAEVFVLAADHLYAQGLRKALSVQATAPVELDWDFAGGRVAVVAEQDLQLALPLRATERPQVDGKNAPATRVFGGIRLALPEGRHLITGAHPDPHFATSTTEKLRKDLERARLERVKRGSRAAAAKGSVLPSIPLRGEASLAGSVTDLELVSTAEGSLLCAAEGQTIHVLTAEGEAIRSFKTDGAIRMLRWWKEHELLLAGCADEKVVAFNLKGERQWTFVSEMHPDVFRAAKTYWFKSAPGHEGIHGLHTGEFLDGKTQAFAGSACTLEILDEHGKLVKRLPQFWGKVATMRIIPWPEGRRSLLAARSFNGGHRVAVIDNTSLDPTPRRYNSVPSGHTFVGGWSSMNRQHLFYEDFDGDGAKEVMSEINGTWNRVTVWQPNGTAEYDVSFGPGKRIPAKNMRDVDTADLTGDGLPDIVVATSSKMLVALNGTCERLWAKRLDGIPNVLACITPGGQKEPRILVGCEDGRVVVLDTQGTPLREAKVKGAPTDILPLQPTEGVALVALATQNGQVKVFGME